MKRDMELIRKILMKIEEDFEPGSGWINNLDVPGYEKKMVAEHCDLLYQDNLVREYNASYADNEIYNFGVGPLTNKGHDLLDNIRDEIIWEKTKKTIKDNDLPQTGKVIAEIAGTFIGSLIKNMNE